MKKIILTGGGTAGHVTPHLALLPALQSAGFEVYYIGSHTGIERGLIKKAGLTYYPVASGKLRRYLDVRNFTDLFRVVKGLGDSLRILQRVKPDLVFSKGGFVSVPVLMAARILKIPCVIHESDLTPGLANRLAAPFAKKICVCFPETLAHVAKNKGILTGMPIRPELLNGSRSRGLAKCAFHQSDNTPVLLVTGGSQGAAVINACLREALSEICTRFRVIHLCGKGNLSNKPHPGCAEFEYVQDGLADLYAAADVVLSRAGASTIFELLAMKKPHLLIPLSKEVSRGDQILNAESFVGQGFSAVLPEEEMNPARLLTEIEGLYKSRYKYIAAMNAQDNINGVERVMEVLNSTLQHHHT
jgi:UDP-N-acetylglucosamine--N-acetylmuramyl-(pentapeptide) pyrophosphoryl-undecaprenol N-acetylglucosamine transferase